MLKAKGLPSGWLLWVALGLIVLGVVGSAQGVWAQPKDSRAYQTVPTRTPLPPPTSVPQPTPPPSTGGPVPYVELKTDVAGVEPGGQFVYTAVAGNIGQQAVEDAVLVVMLPEGISVVETSSSRGDVLVEAGRAYVVLGMLEPGERVELHVRVRVLEDVAPGTVMETQAELQHASGRVLSNRALVLLPPGLLPATGGTTPAG